MGQAQPEQYRFEFSFQSARGAQWDVLVTELVAVIRSGDVSMVQQRGQPCLICMDVEPDGEIRGGLIYQLRLEGLKIELEPLEFIRLQKEVFTRPNPQNDLDLVEHFLPVS